MIIDPRDITPRAMYRFMIGVIVPRPIAFVSTVRADGAFNAAPFSFFCGIASATILVALPLAKSLVAKRSTP